MEILRFQMIFHSSLLQLSSSHSPSLLQLLNWKKRLLQYNTHHNNSFHHPPSPPLLLMTSLTTPMMMISPPTPMSTASWQMMTQISWSLMTLWSILILIHLLMTLLISLSCLLMILLISLIYLSMIMLISLALAYPHILLHPLVYQVRSVQQWTQIQSFHHCHSSLKTNATNWFTQLFFSYSCRPSTCCMEWEKEKVQRKRWWTA